MPIRTSVKNVTFHKPFLLKGMNEVLPAGTYTVETDEERLDSISFPAYRRVLTVLHLRAKSGNPLLTRALTIDPAELDAALNRDRQSAHCQVD